MGFQTFILHHPSNLGEVPSSSKIWMFPKIGLGPQNGWWKSWKTLFFKGWFGGVQPTIFRNTHLFANPSEHSRAPNIPPSLEGAWGKHVDGTAGLMAATQKSWVFYNQLREVGSWNPIIYRVLYLNPRWLGMGFLNHQQFQKHPRWLGMGFLNHQQYVVARRLSIMEKVESLKFYLQKNPPFTASTWNLPFLEGFWRFWIWITPQNLAKTQSITQSGLRLSLRRWVSSKRQDGLVPLSDVFVFSTDLRKDGPQFWKDGFLHR